MSDDIQQAKLSIAVMIAHRGEILLGQVGDSGQWALPSGSLGAGQSLGDAGRAIAESAIEGTAVGIKFQSLACLPGAEGAPQTVVVGLYAEFDSEARARELAGIKSRFFPLDGLPAPLAPDAEAAVRACRERVRVIDLGGAPLEVSYGIDPREFEPQVPDATGVAEFQRALGRPSSGRALLATACLLAGGGLWVSGLTLAMDAAHWIGRRTPLLLGLGILGVVVACLWVGLRRGAPRRLVARVGWSLGSVLVSLLIGALGLVLALWFTDADEARCAFWMWLFSLPLVGLALRILRRGDRPPPHGRLRRGVWIVAESLSFLLVFVPLRAALMKHVTSQDHASVPSPPPDD